MKAGGLVRAVMFGCACVAVGYIGGSKISASKRDERSSYSLNPGAGIHGTAEKNTPSVVESVASAVFDNQLRKASEEKNLYIRRGLIAKALQDWIQADPLAALAYVKRNDPRGDSELAETFFSVWGQIAGAAAIEQINRDPQFRRNAPKLVSAAVSGWAESDLPSASTYVTEMPFTAQREAAIETLGRIYAQRNPREAIDWAGRLPASRGAGAVIERAGRLLAENDPAAVVNLARDTGNPAVKAGLLQAGYVNWGARDSTSALRSLEQFNDDGPLKAMLTQKVIEGLAQTDPSAAVQLLNTQSDPKLRRNGTAVLAREWAASDPQSAATWAMSQPDDQSKTAALTGVVNEWIEKDESTALKWISELPSAATRSYAIAVASSKLAFEYPEMMIDLANSIPDKDLRRRALDSIDSRWMTLDQRKAAILKQKMQY